MKPLALLLNVNELSTRWIKSIDTPSSTSLWSEGWSPMVPKHKTGKSRGGGLWPAGMAAAQQLMARVGHDVTVRKNDRVGGLLRYGIPTSRWVHIDRRVR
jgi:glutamate synthase (NADPH/NADH) small chain